MVKPGVVAVRRPGAGCGRCVVEWGVWCGGGVSVCGCQCVKGEGEGHKAALQGGEWGHGRDKLTVRSQRVNEHYSPSCLLHHIHIYIYI